MSLSWLSPSHSATSEDNVAIPTVESFQSKDTESLIKQFNAFYRKDNYEQAFPLAKRILDTVEDVLGPDHPSVAKWLSKLAALYQAKGDYASAERLYQRSLAIREKALGPAHPDVAQSLNNLALLYQAKGDYASAEPLYQRSLAIWETTLGLTHPDVATSLNNLAWLYQVKGDHASAEPLYRRSLAIREKVLGPAHSAVAQSLNNLAWLYQAKGDYARAERLYQRSLAIWEQALGQAHPTLAASLNNLAELYRIKGDYVGAESFYRRSLAIREKALGPVHPDVAQSLNNLAWLYQAKGDYANAEPLYQRSLAIWETALGPTHPDVATSLNNLAWLYQVKGDYASAEPLYRRSLAIREKAFGPTHPAVAQSLNNLAWLYQAKGDYASAERLYQRSLAIWEEALGPAHPDVAQLLNNLALLYQAKGDYTSAEPLYRRSLAIREKALGPAHPDVAQSLHNLAWLYQGKGDYASAEPLYRRSLANVEQALGPMHSDVAYALNNLAGLYRAQGDHAIAEPLYQRSLVIWEQALGPTHPQVAVALNNLAVASWAKQDIQKALAFLTRATEIEEHNLILNLATGSEAQKQAYVATLTGRMDTVISLSLHSAVTDPAATRLATITALRRKGRVLDAVTESMMTLHRHLAPEDQAVLDQLIGVRTQLASLVFAGSDKMGAEQYRLRIDSLTETQDVLEAKLSANSAVFSNQAQSVTIEQVQHSLPGNAVLVEWIRYRPFDPQKFTYDSPRYAAYVLQATGDPAWVDLGPAASIDKMVTDFLITLKVINGDSAENLQDRLPATEKFARQLDEQLMRPLRQYIGNASLVLLSPDSTLNLVPFGALRDENDHYLLERYTFSYVTSGRDLLRLQTRQPSQQKGLLVAAPDFDGTKHPITTLTANANNRRSMDYSLTSWEPLPGTLEEARAIGQIFPDMEIITGANATESALKQVHGPRILHTATHGFFLPDLPANEKASNISIAENSLLRSGLVLTGANKPSSDNDDGILTALEAAGLDLWGTQLVVLSACETALGKVLNGEGIYGLRRAFVIAGAESQLMSLWSVSDEATRDLMVEYYQRLKQGEGRASALRQAQLKLLHDKQSGHPFFWAGFISAGAWDALSGTLQKND
ncbi:MAG: CHAT domain-containing tetratricopeptide repeat protein [Pseudomonadota bacterium]